MRRRRSRNSTTSPNNVGTPIPPPPWLDGAVTVNVTVVVGELPAALAHASEYVSVPAAVGATV
jgi:hypothetical protein